MEKTREKNWLLHIEKMLIAVSLDFGKQNDNILLERTPST